MKNICLYVVITVIAMLPVPSSCKISENLPGIGEIYSDSFPSSAAERNETVALIKRSLSLHDTPLNGEPFQFAQRREGLDTTTRVEVEKYNYPFIIAARVGAYTFSCRQDNGFLVINRRYPDGRTRVRQTNGEFSIHPQPGLWWFVKCVGFETGGHGLDMTGVSKPGGDSGINPNALKSLIG